MHALELISRYSGASPETAPLHRLGSDQWAKARQRAANKVRDVAAELLDVYARRAARPGHPFSWPQAEYRAFENGFPFELTEDQATTIADVLADLASDRPMDRLVCGDVGFGKTEVALRATFAAVHGGKQVAILVPTTLLAQQHGETFRDRFADWPVRVEVLSRFQSAAKVREIVAGMRAGAVDVVIGTHRLLQHTKDFREVGLVIVDEEHRFGVRHKESIKSLRSDVDVLTLTATPIPRTLNMTLGGMRDMSLITTPPAERLAIKTFVSEWNDVVVREACLREIKRGGQVYCIHNRIEDIERLRQKLETLVPEASIRIGHGQMPERELEQVMFDFYHRRFNLLLCTTIVESGIDVPTANTIIINHADQYGLAQLHQLRGRVGRSHHRAYAYLIAPPKAQMSADAIKRLEAIDSLEDLGAGFTLATHDLEIRGAGELLGDEQSGQIQEIGFSLYMDMLGRAVESLRAGREPDLDAPFDAGVELVAAPDVGGELGAADDLVDHGRDVVLPAAGAEEAEIALAVLVPREPGAQVALQLDLGRPAPAAARAAWCGNGPPGSARTARPRSCAPISASIASITPGAEFAIQGCDRSSVLTARLPLPAAPAAAPLAEWWHGRGAGSMAARGAPGLRERAASASTGADRCARGRGRERSVERGVARIDEAASARAARRAWPRSLRSPGRRGRPGGSPPARSAGCRGRTRSPARRSTPTITPIGPAPASASASASDRSRADQRAVAHRVHAEQRPLEAERGQHALGRRARADQIEDARRQLAARSRRRRRRACASSSCAAAPLAPCSRPRAWGARA